MVNQLNQYLNAITRFDTMIIDNKSIYGISLNSQTICDNFILLLNKKNINFLENFQHINQINIMPIDWNIDNATISCNNKYSGELNILPKVKKNVIEPYFENIQQTLEILDSQSNHTTLLNFVDDNGLKLISAFDLTDKTFLSEQEISNNIFNLLDIPDLKTIHSITYDISKISTNINDFNVKSFDEIDFILTLLWKISEKYKYNINGLIFEIGNKHFYIIDSSIAKLQNGLFDQIKENFN